MIIEFFINILVKKNNLRAKQFKPFILFFVYKLSRKI